MVNWEAAEQGARVGAVIGAVTGLVPLGIGLSLRKRRGALAGFASCVVAGAIGGVYAAIAVMGVTIRGFFPGRVTQAGQQRVSQWSELATMVDKFWYFVMMVWLFVCTIGIMFISAACLTPLVLGVPNCEPRDVTGKIVEPVMLFGGMGVGIIVGLIGVSFISRRLISATTHENWVQRFNTQCGNLPRFPRRVMRYSCQLLLPAARFAELAEGAVELKPGEHPGSG